ncbi:DUF1552 domain-containing protein [Alienimonas californiensis]|uniref:DUF1552 domain-containing protein n=1 Tax=Alienimonas californiensis TaxID=2527989 RepID=A0A517PBN8_9PLAN|nr:DUF1552 domain-containing protein [Alienimonas californiensis]QDT16798.1 hypothetical protein CA12_29050 [Alienimonas californiensis]
MSAFRPARRPGDALPRRTVLKAAGVGLALPWLSAMDGRTAAAAEETPTAPELPEIERGDGPPRRFVAFTLSLGLLGENLNPKQAGKGWEPSRYLEPLTDLRDQLTILSGVSHPGVRSGHRAEASLLTANPAGGNGRGRNTISLDQYLAKHLGGSTRFPSLVLSGGGSNSPCYTDGGAMIPAQDRVEDLFAELFVEDDPAARRQHAQRAAHGRSVMDLVLDDANRLSREVGAGDRRRLDEYFSGVRDLEVRMAADEKWAKSKKPQVEMEPPDEIRDANEFIAKQALMSEVVKLALETDSTRYVVHHLGGSNHRAPLPGVNTGWHSLSHHGKEDDKLTQLAIVEAALIASWGDFLRSLGEVKESGRSLLDSTTVLLTSNLGNASNHDNRNMPVLLAGGGYQHGQHLAHDPQDNAPLPKLFTTIANRHGLGIDRFFGDPGTQSGLELA